jgi:hypothetical protein
MQIKVPDKMGGEIRVVPGSPYEAVVGDVFVGQSQTKNPKATIRWILNSEPIGAIADPPTTGETLLDTYPLQENSIWRFNNTYRALTGENLPQGDYDETTFLNLVKSAIVGLNAKLIVDVEPRQDTGEERNKVSKVSKG